MSGSFPGFEEGQRITRRKEKAEENRWMIPSAQEIEEHAIALFDDFLEAEAEEGITGDVVPVNYDGREQWVVFHHHWTDSSQRAYRVRPHGVKKVGEKPKPKKNLLKRIVGLFR